MSKRRRRRYQNAVKRVLRATAPRDHGAAARGRRRGNVRVGRCTLILSLSSYTHGRNDDGRPVKTRTRSTRPFMLLLLFLFYPSSSGSRFYYISPPLKRFSRATVDELSESKNLTKRKNRTAHGHSPRRVDRSPPRSRTYNPSSGAVSIVC